MKKKISFKNKILNIKQSIKDKRNFRHSDKSLMSVFLPSKISYRNDFVEIYDQGNLGTCYAFGINTMMEHRRIVLGLPRFVFSKMFSSYVIRIVESNSYQDESEMINDNGATLLNTARGMKIFGTILDVLYPYKNSVSYFQQIPRCDRYPKLNIESNFNVLLSTAKLNSIKEYVFLNSISEVKDALNKGFVVGLGIDIYNNFYSLGSKIYSGRISNESLLGGHFIVITGYDDATSTFEFINSWGDDWGDNGFGLMSYDFVNNMINKYDAFRVVLNSENSTILPDVVIKSVNKLTSFFRRN